MSISQPPQCWVELHLSDVADIIFSPVDKKTHPGEPEVRLCNYVDVYKHDYLTDDHDYMRASASRTEIERYRLHDGDIVITKDSETPDDIGVAAVIENLRQPLVCGYHLAILRPRPCADPVFLAKQLGHERVRRHFAKEANGITRYGLTTAGIRCTPIWLPPGREQVRIATILRTLDDAICRTEQVIAKMRQMKQGLLHDLLTRGTKSSEEDRESPRIRDGWISTKLSELLHPVREPGAAGLPTVSVTMTDGLVRRNSDDRRVLTALRPEQHLLVRRGDIAYNMMRMWQGACGLADFDCLVSPAYVVLRMKESLRPRFAYRLFKSPHMIAAFLVHSRGITSDRYRLYPHDLLQIGVCIPEDPDEQERIAEIADSMDVRIASEESNVAKLRSQKRGLMDDLLTGRVRVSLPPESIA
jgi:type I restriction enzyme S subunit